MSDVTVWFNAKCSKCRTTQGILAERGVDAEYVRYLEQTPAREDLERVVRMLGASGPKAIARTSETRWQELLLDGATDEEIYDAMVANPVLIERPIVIRGDRAVVARPPEKVLELLDD